MVRGEGPKRAKIVVVGEAPGKDETKLGRPFVGISGQLLDGILLEAGTSRREVYVTNVFKEEMPFKLKTDHPKLLEAIERLNHEIITINPNVVIALGNYALYALTGLWGIDRYRGSILESLSWTPIPATLKVVPTYHPAHVLHRQTKGGWKDKHLIVFDIKKAVKESKHKDFRSLPKRELLLRPSFAEVMYHLDRLYGSEYVSFDIETTKKEHQLYMISFSDNPNWSMSIPFVDDKSGDFNYPPQELHDIWQGIEYLFASSARFIAHNALFDLLYLAQDYGLCPKIYMDTMIAHHVLYPEFKKDLEFCASIYTNQPAYKKAVGWSTRNAIDSAVTLEICYAIEQLFAKYPSKKKSYELDMSMIEPFMAMQMFGIKCDIKNRDKAIDKYIGDLKELRGKLAAAVGEDINPSSPKQIQHLFYDIFKAPKQYHSKTGKPSVDELSLIKLSKRGYKVLVDTIIEYRSMQKELSTWVDIPLWNDRFVCQYNIPGTETGRPSSTKNPKGYGTNLFNVPRVDPRKPKEVEIRDLFIADEGKILVELDLKQAEMIVVIYLAQDPLLLRALKEGKDLHNVMCSIIFDIVYEEVDKDSIERYLSKKSGHSYNYKEGIRRFRDELLKEGFDIDEKRIKSIRSKIEHLLNIKHWQDDVWEQLKKTRTFVTPLGRESLFTEAFGPELHRQALAYVPQSTVGDLGKIGLKRIYDTYGDVVDILNTGYDSVLCQIGKDNLHYIPGLVACMETFIYVKNKPLCIPVDVKVGQSWGRMKKWKKTLK